MLRKIYSAADLPPKVRSGASGDGRTKQSFQKECDINQIMAKYQKSGAITHANQHQPNYGFATSNDFLGSMVIVTQAQQMFDDLPSSIRTKFGNQPELFLDFVQDPANEAEMKRMGLIPSEPESDPVAPVAPPDPDPEPAAAPPEA